MNSSSINRSRLFIYRPLVPESAAELRVLQGRYANVGTFRPVDNPHLTLLQGSVMPPRTKSSWSRIIENGPTTTDDTYDMSIEAVRLHPRGHRLAGYAISLMLDISDGQYHDEATFFSKMSSRVAKKQNSFIIREPHVTVGLIDSAFALDSLLESAQSYVGRRLAFGAIESSLGRVSRSEADIPRHPSDVQPVEGPVGTVRPRTVPASFLASLRPERAEERGSLSA